MTTKPWRLTRQAEASLTDIARWTIDTFGTRQADAYEADLIDRCTAIANGLAVSQSCRALIDLNLPEDLRFARAGQHFIVFVEDPEQVIILDFLHARSDLPARLERLNTRSSER
ncbi:type II toxin-antitoxin system RelE/ParE family toxin [Acuticoccus sp. I52.16.1]|uniref:type II toxin-antitoxin system RelE/ParE family toxin n=1 Tax=Acuticoccus sp. I52.16.1 TaxID=2928472 RepID=UPI001FD44B0D|nr:type II toxin-antitoxin system RelE/ParE family toxin [Acuticoccus sp. I52.16.1]UOM36653.1 type II toxin-antitoxin system RelE/ParE family toxin [Acuticoccus sp. I52.16.1]